MRHLPGGGEGLAVADFCLYPGHFRRPSRDSLIAMVCQDEAPRDETCDLRMDEDAEYGSEPSLICTEM
ncbi:hypothetical protein EI555_021318 [Monodon monoceros]|uniref:Uncharacterized protein n=1 Tax=Monodon monoceros TaxID=40151 RepID=A0A4U1F8L1_MONMO|nr:hypothetical protein EI555_021318 [Monodon monoceros]